MATISTARDLGRAIRGARIQSGLSQQGLANKTGLSRKFIFDLESGKETAELGASLRVADALNIRWAAPPLTPQTILEEAARDIARELSSGDGEFALRIAMDSLKQLKKLKPERLKKPRPTGSERFDALLAAGARIALEGVSAQKPRWGKKLQDPWFPGDDTRSMSDAFRELTIKRTPKTMADFNIFLKDNSLEMA
ncbi:hypothetical protein CQ010_13580 [Arthrobacter sp. MYb211]|uniref:helix-turn-helix domain-containing protein n=1 Tax=Micrococcaceae TaxID=1268 RepID=UPI000CFC3536|nr:MULTISPECIES: helix-turn-helix domain-containing protein [unclassified Arthrobacter]PQZ96985.1 hypothetical protein CQ017_15270 [Arthrobacter sp. MYb224]PRA10502.1 hypothetical protein CQ015_13570 [Arthrobacter sp. MYb221]PRC06072.1 hypothetical protein CQ010_13580 [Arthrobacter sp. MYb211]